MQYFLAGDLPLKVSRRGSVAAVISASTLLGLHIGSEWTDALWQSV
jgi:hypothetical protein